MPSSTTISGKEGKVALSSPSDLAHVTLWSMDQSDSAPSWNSSSTAGHKTRKSGVRDATGSIEGKYDQDDPIEQRLGVGSAVSLKLYQRADRYITVAAIITGLSLNVNIDTGDIESWTASWGATSAPVYP